MRDAMLVTPERVIFAVTKHHCRPGPLKCLCRREAGAIKKRQPEKVHPFQSIQQWEGFFRYRRRSEAIRVANLLAAYPLTGGRTIASNLLTPRVTELIRNAEPSPTRALAGPPVWTALALSMILVPRDG